MKIYASISSEGFGHSSRAIALARYLAPEQFLVGSYGIALKRISRYGLNRVAVPQELKLVGKAGSFDMGQTILSNPGRALGFNQIVDREADIMRREGVSLVVADGRMAPVVAASKLELPCVVLTNQSAFYPFFAKDTALVKLLGLSFDVLMRFWLSSAEEIFIPDFPPPHTVCLPNLSPKRQVKKRTRFVGPMVAWQADEVEPMPPLSTDRIVVSLGGHDYRKPVFDEVLRLAPQFPNCHFDVLCNFKPEGSLPDNVTLYGQVPNCAPFFKAARLVITQAGHSSAMELLTLGKPSVIIPDTAQAEQENNAQRMVDLGVSLKATYTDLAWGSLGTCLQEALDTERLGQAAERLAEQAKVLNGAKQAAESLLGYAGRLNAY